MKTISAIFLIIFNLYALGQNVSNDKSIIGEVFLSLPDSIVKTSFFELPKSKREVLWNAYKEEVKDNSYDKLDFYILVNEKENKIEIVSIQSDQSPRLVIKLFNSGSKPIITTAIDYYNGATTSSEGITFYDYKSSKIKDITHKVLDSFNFFTDNFSDSTINILSNYWSSNLRDGSGPSLIYNFTNGDTIEITNSFFNYFYEERPDPGLDTTYFDGEFYTKKYIMDNGKLKLAE